MSDFDICKCGDYRHQHLNGEGMCRLNGLGHGGAPACGKFELWQQVWEAPRPPTPRKDKR